MTRGGKLWDSSALVVVYTLVHVIVFHKAFLELGNALVTKMVKKVCRVGHDGREFKNPLPNAVQMGKEGQGGGVARIALEREREHAPNQIARLGKDQQLTSLKFIIGIVSYHAIQHDNGRLNAQRPSQCLGNLFVECFRFGGIRLA